MANINVASPGAQSAPLGNAITALLHNPQAGVARTILQRLQEPYISVKDYGATGDGTTDDTAAIRAALAAAMGRRVFFPKGDYLVSAIDAAGYLFKLDRQIQIFGEGSMVGGSVIKVASTVPSTTDVFRIEPQLNTGTYSSFGWSITDLRIAPASGTPARHGIFVNLGVNQFLAKFVLARCYIGPFGGSCFKEYKDTSSDVASLFTTTIRDNFFYGGGGGCLYLDNTGDSLFITENTITGSGLGIYLRPVSGAAMQVIAFNNITAAGGAIWVYGGSQAKILHNQIEQSQTYTGTVSAMVILDGAGNCDVVGNNLNAYDRVSCIRIRGTGGRRNSIEHNVLACSATASKYHVVFDSDVGSHNMVGFNDWLADSAAVYSPRISDGNSNVQVGIWKALTLLNSWAAASDSNYYQGAWYRLTPHRTVEFRGSIASGTTTAGTALTSSTSVGARPSKTTRGIVHVFNGTSWVTGSVNFSTTGNLAIQSMPSNTLVMLDGLVLPISDS